MDDHTSLTAATDTDEISIALLVDRASDPIAGTLSLPHGPPVPFTGWMQLTQQLARALDAGR